jgi:hypothetical protein
MPKRMLKTPLAFFLMAAILLLSVPAVATASDITEAEACAHTQQFLPPGIGFEKASAEQMEEAIIKAVSSWPDAVLPIVRCATRQVPDMAAVIAAAAASVLPHQASPITLAAQEIAPRQIRLIWTAVDQALLGRGQETAVEIVKRVTRDLLAGEPPPARDDAPASPVR